MRNLSDDCFLHDRSRMRHEEAVNLLRERMHGVVGTCQLRLSDAIGYILSEPIHAFRAVPAFNNSAVDGYAFAFDDYQASDGYFLLCGRITAGATGKQILERSGAVRIFTGAPMPEGADTVVMQEDCQLEHQGSNIFVKIPQGLKHGANCRLAGEDVGEGETVAEAGEILDAPCLGAVASTGRQNVAVFKPLRIGLLSSGDEILRPGDVYSPGKAYDANHFMLQGLMTDPFFTVCDLGVCRDQKKQVLHTLVENVSGQHDVLISTGGASRGEEDHFVNALDELGSCHLWQLAVKPGRPMSFGQIGQTPCFTLPGNPVAAFVCFLLYVRPALKMLAGGNWPDVHGYWVRADFDMRSKPDRREFLRGYVSTHKDGGAVIRKFSRDGSGLISGLREATGLIEIPEETIDVSRGNLLRFLPFSELL